ncbi:MAG TPA: glucokinase [Burkholderiales bacterium]|nr:glucokinase [Burkholderiales bacterium]
MSAGEDNRMHLLADIGGTNVRFALLAPGTLQPLHEQSYRCADFNGLEHAVRTYLAQTGNPEVVDAAFDVATAVTGDLIRLTNSPWAFSIEQTRRQLNLNRLVVLNDFTALALSVPTLTAAEMRRVGGGSVTDAKAIAVIGAGTGLGMSGLFRVGGRWFAIEGEGGHGAFSPMDDREDAVLHVLRERFGHVSNERLLSGPGLVNIYEALCRLAHVAVQALAPERITEFGINGSDAQCAEALAMFCAALGTAAANLALTLGARGGVYVGGGIVPQLGDYFERSRFRSRFEHKGRFSSYMAAIPTYVITGENMALRGLALALFPSGAD